ncbi:MAG: MerR family transcriptional regulator [Acidimicrobiales bacterium]
MVQPPAEVPASNSVPPEAELTIDQLAQGAGIPASTVRLYQNKGLLPPPERRGRVGYYAPGHQDRLRLIAHLQERGFSLAAIKEALDSWNAGHSLDHLLGVSGVAPLLVREPLRLSPAELAERFEGVELTQADIQRTVEIGLVELDGAELVVSSEAFADIGPAVARLGVPVPEILDEYEAMSDAVGEIAERFRAVFERHVWQPFVARGMPADELSSLSANVAQLTELATSVVTTELHQRFAAFADGFVQQAEGDGSS